MVEETRSIPVYEFPSVCIYVNSAAKSLKSRDKWEDQAKTKYPEQPNIVHHTESVSDKVVDT